MLLEIHARKIWMKYFTWKRSSLTCSFATRSNLLFSEIHLVAHKGMYILIFSCINNEIREIQLLSNNILYALGHFSRHLRISQKWWESLSDIDRFRKNNFSLKISIFKISLKISLKISRRLIKIRSEPFQSDIKNFKPCFHNNRIGEEWTIYDQSFCDIESNQNDSQCRSSRPQVVCKKGVLRNFAKLTGKHLFYRPSLVVTSCSANELTCFYMLGAIDLNWLTLLLRKSMDWFLHDIGLRHERVKEKKWSCYLFHYF